DYRNSKVQRLRLDRHGLSWASRSQKAMVGESNIGGPGGRKRARVGSALADINDSTGCGETGSWAGLRQQTRCPPWGQNRQCNGAEGFRLAPNGQHCSAFTFAPICADSEKLVPSITSPLYPE